MSHNSKMLSKLIFIMVLLFASPVFSEVIYKPLNGITEGLSFPIDVAVSESGAVFVADSLKKKVFIYNTDGQLTGSIAVASPDAVAVGRDGTIYVATSSDLSVRMYDAAGVIVGALGRGAGEFKLPRNIRIDRQTGIVYVVDALDDSIKVYTAAGGFLRRIDDTPNLPQDVTVTKDGIFVADQPLVMGWYSYYHTSGVRVYDMSGNPISNFGVHGWGEGEIYNPRGIAADSLGQLYVTDIVATSCFTSQGEYLGRISDINQPLILPMGLDITDGGRLYVAYPFSSLIKLFDILIAPVALDNGNGPVIIWQKVNAAGSYEVQYADNPGFENAITIQNIVMNSYTVEAEPEGGVWYWRVRAMDADGNVSGWSAVETIILVNDDGHDDTDDGDAGDDEGHDDTTIVSIDQLCPDEGPIGTETSWRNHGEYVSCISDKSKNLLEQGLITKSERGEIVSGAAITSSGKKEKN